MDVFNNANSFFHHQRLILAFMFLILSVINLEVFVYFKYRVNEDGNYLIDILPMIIVPMMVAILLLGQPLLLGWVDILLIVFTVTKLTSGINAT